MRRTFRVIRLSYKKVWKLLLHYANSKPRRVYAPLAGCHKHPTKLCPSIHERCRVAPIRQQSVVRTSHESNFVLLR